MDDLIDRVSSAVSASAGYRNIDAGFVRRIAEAEAAKGRSYKETVKAVKNKLHQVGGAYLGGTMDYTGWLARLREAQGDLDRTREVCRGILERHASTRERLPFLDRFYTEILAGIETPRTIIDLACGLNPVALPWMGLPVTVEYTAVDIYRDMIDFLNQFFSILGVLGRAVSGNALENEAPGMETGKVIEFSEGWDLALLLKAIPCLEQVDKAAGRKLLQRIHARTMVVSFPARSLGGRNKGMDQNYTAHFLELIEGLGRQVRRIDFPNELVFVLT